MPGGFPLGLDVCNGQDAGGVTGTSQGTIVNPSASANTKGSWVQLIASTAADAVWMMVQWSFYQDVGSSAALDIGVGGSGSEQVLVSNLISSNSAINGFDQNQQVYSFPCQIPAGTRIAARTQVSAASDTGGNNLVNVTLYDGAFTQMEGCAGVDALGFSTGTTLGTQVDPGGTANTKGAYSQIIASTARDYMGLLLGFDTQNDSTSAFAQFLVDVAIGGSGSEKIIMPNLQLLRTTKSSTSVACEYILPPSQPFIPIAIPAGTRIAARAQCSINTATRRLFGITAYGVYQ